MNIVDVILEENAKAQEQLLALMRSILEEEYGSLRRRRRRRHAENSVYAERPPQWRQAAHTESGTTPPDHSVLRPNDTAPTGAL
jgi:hypothetical protein